MRWMIILLLVTACFYSQGQVSLGLVEALSQAVRNNPGYRTERYNVDMARSAVVTAGLHTNPSFGIATGAVPASRYYAPGTGFLSGDNMQTTYQLSKVIRTAGQLRYNVASAKSGLDITSTSLDQFKWNLMSEVANQWLDAWYAREKVKLVELAKSNSDTILKVNQLRLKNQVITTIEYSRSRIIGEQYALLELSAMQEYRNKKNDLALMLGDTSQSGFEIAEGWLNRLMPVTYDSILNMALRNRLEIVMGRQMVAKARIDESLQKALARPQPEIGMNYGAQNRVPYVGISFSVPLPVSDRNQGEIERAKIAVEQAGSQVDASILQVKNDVRNAYDLFVTSKNSWERYEELVRQSEQVLKTVRISYLKGGTTILDYLEAEKSWFDMQSSYFESMYNYRKSYLQLVFVSQYQDAFNVNN